MGSLGVTKEEPLGPRRPCSSSQRPGWGGGMPCRDSAAPSVTLLGRSLANAERVALQTLPDVCEPELGYLFKAEPRVSVLPDCSDARELCAYRFWTLDDISGRSKSLPALIESSQHDDLLMAQLGG